jgi:MFS family permease
LRPLDQTGGMSSRYSWYVVGVLTLANISANIDQQILALLAVPIRRDLGLSLTEMSYLIGLPFAIFYSVMGLPIARSADRGNRRNIIAIGIGLWSIMTALCGLAGTYWRLLLARIGVGVGEAALFAPSASLVSDYFPRERLASAMAVYATANFIGSGIAYFVGGWAIGIAETQSAWTWPLIGTIRPWQSVFLMVGLPGLLIALLMLTVREPARAVHSAKGAPLGLVFRYLRDNLRTFVCVSLGFAFSATVNFSIVAWLATFLVQKHGWPLSRAGMVMGVLTITVGTLGVMAGGRLADRFVQRGRLDGPLLVGIVGAAGMLVSASAYPFAPNGATAVGWLVLVNFFAAFPWGAASAAAAQIVPSEIRAQGTALYFFVLSLTSRALGPISVAAITDFVFGDEAMLPYSLAIVNILGMTLAIALLAMGRSAFRRTLESRDRWVPS